MRYKSHSHTAEFPESLVSDSKHRVSRLSTRISLGLGIEPMNLSSLGLGIEVYKRGDSESDSEYKPTILIMNGKGDLYEFEHKFVWDLWEEINKGADFSLMQLIIKDTSGIKNPEIKYEYDIIREVALRSSKDIYHC